MSISSAPSLAALRTSCNFKRNGMSPVGKAGGAFFGHDLIENGRGARRIPLEASGFKTRVCFHEMALKRIKEKVFVRWRPLLRRNPILTQTPPVKAMQTFLLFLAFSEPSPLALMITGAISLGLLAIFLHHKLG